MMNKEQFINELIEKLYQKTGRKPLIKESERLNEDGQDILVIRGEKSDMQRIIKTVSRVYPFTQFLYSLFYIERIEKK